MSKTTIMITGLCLQGNKGGPAIALSLMKQLRIYLNDVDYILSVPNEEEFKYEKVWAEKLSLKIVEDYSLRDLLPSLSSKQATKRQNRKKVWFDSLNKSDLLLDMSGVSYVGPPSGSNLDVLRSRRFRCFLTAKYKKKPFLAWTQSYGPISTFLVKMLAKLDLRCQPTIFCRGDTCSREIRSILPGKKIMSFPDVANVLSYDYEWGKRYLFNLTKCQSRKGIVTMSPSSVIYSKTSGEGSNNVHLKNMGALACYLNKMGYIVVLVPHTFRPDRHDLRNCDYAISLKILEKISATDSIFIVSEDLSSIELKSIISNASVHIGGRYHSIVAALSSGVPSIALSWHPKYRDIMKSYDCEKYLFDELKNENHEMLFKLLDEVIGNRNKIAEIIISKQADIRKQIEENTALFARIVKEALK